MIVSAYVHIPFCKSKCHYCSFVSFCNLESKKDYIEALHKEISSFYKKDGLDTLYFGGGTPSILDSNDVARLLGCFNFAPNAEITMELNPDDVDIKYLKDIYDLGVNRLSFGCQTFDDNLLQLINRRHNSKQVFDVVKIAKDVGFKSISLDFLYGLPTQTEDMFLKDLSLAFELGIQHISLYGLKIEEGCFFYNNVPENLPDDDLQADMYLSAIEFLVSCGFEHYEVSNFSKIGFNSRHNLAYWSNNEYYGFGVGAHGYENGVRYENKTNIIDYINNPLIKKNSNMLTSQECLEEEIFLGLRKMSGINVEDINSKYEIDFDNKYRDVLKKYLNLNLLNKTSKGYAFTPNGILVSNVILADFLEDA